VGIQGFVDLSLQDLEEGHPAREHMQEVLAASDKAGALVRQLLAFSRSEAMRPQVLGINEVIQGLHNMLTHLVGEHIVLELAFGTDVRGVVGDARQLEQVILNLCVNSRDATAGGGRIVIETANATLDDAFVQGQPWALQGDFVLIRVSDNGAGMPEDVKEHLFEPFFTTKGPGQGTGMGLATVYSIVKQHHGLIHCESAPGVGTRFSVYLPVAPAGTAAAAAPGALADPAGGDETVLLVEDNEIVRRLACRVLRRAGYRILEACDGEAAMRVFRANASEVDLALIDVVMPGMSGRAVAENIRARNPSLPILFSSGYDFRLLDDALRDWEHTEIVHKPYHPKELLRRVRDALDAKGRDDG
jgi:two-component system cell cycle sensor histidine kinase/response regulator CckA